MEADLQRRVQRYGWDKAAPHYENFWAAQLQPAQDLLLEKAAIMPGERVIETACGTGLLTFRVAARLGATGHLLATDISEKMVVAVQDRAATDGVRLDVRRMDAESLDVTDASFDVALCALGLMYCPDPVAAMREMHRALVPGGRAAAAVWGPRRNCGWAEIFPIVERRVASDVCPLFFQLGNDDTLAESFRIAGFANAESERLSVRLHYETTDDAIGAAFAGGPVALPYSRFDDATRDSVHAEYLESIAAFRSGEGYDIPGEYVVATARN